MGAPKLGMHWNTLYADCLKIIQDVNERVYTVPGMQWNTRYPDCVRNIHLGRNRFAKPNRNRFQILGFMQSICRIWNRFHKTGETFSGDGFICETITWLYCYWVLFAVDANFCSSFTVNMRVIQSKVCCCDKENNLAKLYIKLCRNLLCRNTSSQRPWRPVLHSDLT